MRILLIEDDDTLAHAMGDHLLAEGHALDHAATLEAAGACIASTSYDLLLLDLMLPDGAGIDFLRRRRSAGDKAPVIILTALDRVSDRIAGLNAGADDYLVKPFDLSELSARVSSVCRRYAGNPIPVRRVGDSVIDLAARIACRDGQSPIHLTSREWAILEMLLLNPRMVVSKSQIEEMLYSFGHEIESNAVEVYVARIRKKLGSSVITTLRGVGYRLGGEPGRNL